MASKFYIKQNDTRPAITAQLLENGSAVDISGAAITFHMGDVSLGAATIVTASTGNVSYQWQTGDTDTARNYPAEFQVVFSDGRIETFPNDENLIIVITEELA